MPYRLLEGERAAIGSAVVHLIWKGKEPQPGQTSVVSQQDLLWYLECNCGTGGMAIAGSQVEGDLASLCRQILSRSHFPKGSVGRAGVLGFSSGSFFSPYIRLHYVPANTFHTDVKTVCSYLSVKSSSRWQCLLLH